ncbi:hypothetical protein K0B04_00960 [Patescibacteria group bacterium]|nr:hypothetical protein [Patescibacteria group bacterium]
MKKFILSSIAVIAISFTVFSVNKTQAKVTLKETGNGAPSGAHYNLNIIGVSTEKTAPMDSNNGHRIFVSLEGNTRINLSEGDYFQVLDANGTDGKASFQLPNPDPDNDGITRYSVWARALGKPGGKARMTTGAVVYNEETGEYETVYSVEVLEVGRTKGKSTFTNVSKQLLYIYVDLDGDGVTERYNLFSDALQDYFWSYDNQGLKLLQLRFYEIETNVEL